MKRFNIICLVFSVAQLYSIAAFGTEMCDSTVYTNQTVSTEVIVHSQDPMSVSNVTVTPTGRLTLIDPNGVVLNGGTTVNVGGTLNIYTDQVLRIRYAYDASGNRVRREKDTTN